MLIYPNFNPIAIQLGPIKVHWYGLMYLLGFALTWGLGVYRARAGNRALTPPQVADMLFYGALGVVIGGRVGYMLFYDFGNFIHAPWIFFRVWDGGMSFHGGFLGVLLAMWLYSRRIKCHWVDILEFLAPMVPLGLAAGRFGNFINDELWGRVTDSPIGMIFPTGGPLPRYPSQLIEMCLEGFALFIILWFASIKPKPRYFIASLFLLGYGCFRFIGEFFREPDPQRGYILFGWMTEGQLLSIPMIILGAFLLLFIVKWRKKVQPQEQIE